MENDLQLHGFICSLAFHSWKPGGEETLGWGEGSSERSGPFELFLHLSANGKPSEANVGRAELRTFQRYSV